MNFKLIFFYFLSTFCFAKISAVDEFEFLEEVESQRSMNWVKKQNEITLSKLKSNPKFEIYLNQAKEFLNANDRIPFGQIYGASVRNFWTDEKHARGVWRQTTLESYKNEKPNWDIILDIGKLGQQEGESWVYQGSDCLLPDYKRCLLSLSRGGKDAVVIREFDIQTKSFIKKSNFEIAESKGSANWYDIDQIIVSSDFGKDTMTDSGYPRQVRLWKRGTNIQSAPILIECSKVDIDCSSWVDIKGDDKWIFLRQSHTFYEASYFVWKDQKKYKLDIPIDADIRGLFDGWLLVVLKSDLQIKKKKFTQGSLVAYKFDKLVNGEKDISKVIAPNEKMTISEIRIAKDFILVNVLENVQGKVFKFKKSALGWSKTELELPSGGVSSIVTTSPFSNNFMLSFESFLVPTGLYLGSENSFEKIKSQPEKFDSKNLETKQYWATSADGTKIPYFIVGKKDLVLDGKNPTVINGYGGFEVSMDPYYLVSIGKLWLERGGVFVMANIRGGGEFGPAWHQAALLKNRHKAFEDFIAVTEDLISKKITSPDKIAIKGGSNGGLLMGAMVVLRPDLFNAVICQVPLLDMLRYHKLLAGASWVGEYGNPDEAEMREYWLKYSPYHNLEKEKEYPEVFFMTSTKDDRVHPAHARKMAAKMQKLAHPIFYYENIEGGHGGAADNDQKALRFALEFSYLDLKITNLWGSNP